MAFTPQEQQEFLQAIGMTQLELPAGAEQPEPEPDLTETVDAIEFDWSMIDGLSLTSKDDWEAAYRILFNAHKRHRRDHPGWNRDLHAKVVSELNTRRQASKTGYVKEKVKASRPERAANITRDIASILSDAGVEIDDDALDEAIQGYLNED